MQLSDCEKLLRKLSKDFPGVTWSVNKKYHELEEIHAYYTDILENEYKRYHEMLASRPKEYWDTLKLMLPKHDYDNMPEVLLLKKYRRELFDRLNNNREYITRRYVPRNSEK